MFGYETSIRKMPKFHVLGLNDSTKEIRTVDIESRPSFVLRFNKSRELKITKFAESLSSSELIENLEDLLFSN